MTSSGRKGWELAIDADGIIVGDDGSVRFTGRYRKELTDYFAMAGIDIQTIKTKEAYLEARRAASPYFDQWVASIVESGTPSTERRLLLATVSGDTREARKLKIQLDSERATKKKPQKGG